ncbi:MAG TPA: VOC family protein [Dehalococcoidia bacterium]|nr:VOC family protein [Dehalococcoidia bacterium]
MTLAKTKIQVTGLDHVVLHVRDLKRSKHFYLDLLGLPVYRETETQCFVRCGDQLLALFERKDGEIHPGQGLDHIALDVAAITYEELKDVLAEAGVTLEGPGGQMRPFISDPDGHRVQLLRPGHRAQSEAG